MAEPVPQIEADGSITSTELLARIDAGETVNILDVRSEGEFEAGHVPGARNIPFTQVPLTLERSARDPRRGSDPLLRPRAARVRGRGRPPASRTHADCLHERPLGRVASEGAARGMLGDELREEARSPTHRSARRARLTVLVLSCVLALTRSAQAAESWGEIGLPGGSGAARRIARLGDSNQRPDAAWLLDLIRRDGSGDWQKVLVPLEDYLLGMEEAQGRLGQWPEGIALPVAATSNDERSRIEDTLASLGLRLRRERGQYHADDDPSDRASNRRQWLTWAGINLEKVTADLNFGLRVRVALSESPLPLPLPSVLGDDGIHAEGPAARHAFARSLQPLGLHGADGD